MNKILLSLLIACFASRLSAETLSEQYAQYGRVIVVKLDSAPFPHPARVNGHKYQDKVYTAEKNYSDNRVAIFIPKGFRPGITTDFVMHFYGWRHHIESTLSEYKLIEQFTAAGRNAILIVPQGPYDAADSFDGKMDDTDGFKHLMQDIVKTLADRGEIRTRAIGQIILSGHSGGYGALSPIIARGGLSDKVKEVWLFDALYAGTENFDAWYKKYPNRRIIDIYTQHGGTDDESTNLMTMFKKATPPVPFIAKNEVDVKPSTLKSHRAIFIFSDLEHDHVVYKRNEYQEYLETSSLPSLRLFTSPKQSGE